MSPLPGIYASAYKATASPLINAFDALSTATLSSGASTVTFSGIPSGYKHLQLRVMAQNGRNSTANGFLTMQFNGAYGARYQWLKGDGATLDAGNSVPAVGEGYVINVCGTVSNTYGLGIVDVFDYASTTKKKSIRILSGNDCSGSGIIGETAYLVNDTAAITSITIVGTDSANMSIGSTFSLYGIK